MFQVCTILGQTSYQYSKQEDTTLFQELETEAQNLGYQWNRNSINQSISIYLELTNRWKRLNKLDKQASCFRKAGRLNIILSNKQEALNLFGKALKIINKEKEVDEKIKILSELSLVTFDLGNLNDSKKYLDEALDLELKTNSYSAKATVLFVAGEFYYFRNELETSLRFYKKSLENWKQAGDLLGEAKTLISTGYIYFQLNNYSLSLKLFNQAWTIYKNFDYERGKALALKAIGTIYNATNEKQKALEFYQKALQLFSDNIDLSEKAPIYNGISSIYEFYREYQQAISYRKKALNLFQQDNYKFGQLATLTSLGELSFSENDFTLALNYFSQANALAKSQNDRFYLAIISEGLGSIHSKNGDYKKALLYFNKALQLLRLQANNRPIAKLLIKIGQIHLAELNFILARNFFLESLKLNKNVKDNFAEADTRYSLAMMDASRGKFDLALESVKASVELTESLTSDVFNSKLKSVYFSNVFDRYELYINLLMKMHRRKPKENYAVQALQAAEKSRARLMLETLQLSEANFTKDADPKLVKREKETRILLNAKADKLTDLLSQDADKSEIDKLDGEINELKNELEEIKATLKKNSLIYSTIKNPAPFDIREFQKNMLDEKTLLLEFSFGKEESYLWLVGKNEFNAYVLPSRDSIESRIRKLRELLSRDLNDDESIESYQSRLAKAEKEFRREAQMLSEELLGKVAEKIKERRLIIVADGKLHYFPIAALPFPNSENGEPILLTNEIIYEPSASMLNLLKKSQNPQNVPSKNILVFADPIFSNDDSRIATEKPYSENKSSKEDLLDTLRFAESVNSLPRLIESKNEADLITESVGNFHSDIFSDSEANLENVLNPKISDYKVIHFATHGLLNEERPELSAIVLSQINAEGQKQNGLLRIYDIYGLNLNSDLVVLSACNTGIGKEVKGEGLQSLNNAFLSVGAKTVLSSLWKVDDNATKEIMKNFYEGLVKEKLTPSEALRQAQIKMWENPRYKLPFYWAAFTIQGDYQNTPELSKGFDYSKYFFLIITVFVFFGVYQGYKLLKKRTKSFN